MHKPSLVSSSLILASLLLGFACGDDGGGSGTTGGGGDDLPPPQTDDGASMTMPADDGVDDDGVDDGMMTSTSTGPGEDDTMGDDTAGTTGEPQPKAPPGWTCDPLFYGEGSCDCGCGVTDVDCADMTNTSCEFCVGCTLFGEDCTMLVDAADNSMCSMGTCGNMMLEGGEACDGNDGFPKDFTCEALGFMPEGMVACSPDCTQVDLSMCMGGPEGWTCEPAFFDADDGCDCGCGVTDPDCADMTSGVCEYCNDLGSCAPFNASNCATAT